MANGEPMDRPNGITNLTAGQPGKVVNGLLKNPV